MAGSMGKNDFDDNSFLDFGPDPIDKEVYNEIVNKELDAAREEEGRHHLAKPGVRHFGRTKKKSRTRTIIKTILITVVSLCVLYGGLSYFITDYYGDSKIINKIKYCGYDLQSDYRIISKEFDSIDIQLENCDISVYESSDDRFHISYKVVTAGSDGIKFNVEERDGSRVLTCDMNNKKNNNYIWNAFGHYDYEYKQYVTIYVPAGQYKNFTLCSEGESGYIYVDLDRNDPSKYSIDELNVKISNSKDYGGIRGVSVKNLSVETDSQHISIEFNKIENAVVKTKAQGLSMHHNSIATLCEVYAENSYVIIDDMEVEDGGRLVVNAKGDDVSLELSDDPELYHITADSETGSVYCSDYDYYGESSLELGSGSREIELHNEDEGIFIYFKVDE